MLPISVCIIAKNEEKNIEKLLKSLQPYSFEIVVVDTGSTDLTKAVASKYTEHIYDFPWIDDFSAARNFSVSKASNDWILYLDCDHILEPFDSKKLCSLIEGKEEILGDVLIKNMLTTSSGESSVLPFSCPLLFHRKYYRFEYPIHEQLVPLAPIPLRPNFATNLSVLHSGYNVSKEEDLRKQERNIRLLEKMLPDCPQQHKSYIYYQLGTSYKNFNPERSLEYFKKARELGISPFEPYLPLFVIEYGFALFRHEEPEQALALLKDYSDSLYQFADLHFLMGVVSMNLRRYEDAVAYFQQALSSDAFLIQGRNSYVSYYNLGIIYQLLGNWQEAIRYFKQCNNYKDSEELIHKMQEKLEHPMPISICMIGKNEEKYLDECLRHLVPLNCELIFVDTGSSDCTVQIASRYTKNIYSFEWCDDFSKARNFSASKATNDWILVVDCDEILENPEEIYLGLPAFLKEAEAHQSEVGIALQINQYRQGTSDSVSVAKPARFYSKKYCRFSGKIHEQILLHSREASPRYLTPFRLLHLGYYGSDMNKKKAERNIPLLLQDLEENGPSPYIYYQLGKAFYSIKDYEKALAYFDSGLSMDVDPSLSYVQQMVETYGYTLLELGQTEEALGLEGVYDTFSVHADFVFLMGIIYMRNGMFQAAIDEFEKAAQFPEADVYGVNGFLSYYNIGVIYECAGLIDQAVSYYKKCGDYPLAKERIDKIN